MGFSRRNFLLSGVSGLALSGCATNLTKYSGIPVTELAASEGVCYSVYVALRGGQPAAPTAIYGCGQPDATGPDGILQAASLTKPVIAFLVLQLAQAGKIDLQAPVSAYLPDGYLHRQKPFAGPNDNPTDLVSPDILARMPVATLLNHTSGLPNWTSGFLAPDFEPGQRWQYSGEGYLILQRLITAVTGETIETAVSKFVFEPLGMKDSRMFLTDDIRERVVDGTGWLGGSQHFAFSEPNAAASMYTTAADYAAFPAALASRRDLLSLTIAAPIPFDQDLGLGIRLGHRTRRGRPLSLAMGQQPGVSRIRHAVSDIRGRIHPADQ